MSELAKLSEDRLAERLKREQELTEKIKILKREKKQSEKKCDEMLEKCERIQIQCQHDYTFYDVYILIFIYINRLLIVEIKLMNYSVKNQLHLYQKLMI